MQVYPVSNITAYLRELLESDTHLADLWVSVRLSVAALRTTASNICVVSLPVLLIMWLMQRDFISGVSAGALKA